MVEEEKLPTKTYTVSELEYNGEKHTRKEWCKLYNVPYPSFIARYNKTHNMEIALGLVKNERRKKMVELNGEMFGETELCRKYNVNYNTYRSRIERGYTVEESLGLIGKSHDYKRKIVDIHGESYSVAEWCDILCVDYDELWENCKKSKCGIEKGIRKIYNGEKFIHMDSRMELEKMCKSNGLTYTCVRERAKRRQCAIADAITSRSYGPTKLVEINGEKHGILEWLRILGYTYTQLIYRCKKYNCTSEEGILIIMDEKKAKSEVV